MTTTGTRVRPVDGPEGAPVPDHTSETALDALRGVLRGFRARTARTAPTLSRVEYLADLVRAAEAARDAAALEAHAAGLSWTQLATPLGISKQATAKRYAGKGTR